MKKATKKKKPYGNPIVSFRLKRKSVKALEDMARETGFADRATFLREFIEASVAGDIVKLQEFNAKCFRRMVERAQAQLPGLMEAPVGSKKGRGV